MEDPKLIHWTKEERRELFERTLAALDAKGLDREAINASYDAILAGDWRKTRINGHEVVARRNPDGSYSRLDDLVLDEAAKHLEDGKPVDLARLSKDDLLQLSKRVDKTHAEIKALEREQQHAHRREAAANPPEVVFAPPPPRQLWDLDYAELARLDAQEQAKKRVEAVAEYARRHGAAPASHKPKENTPAPRPAGGDLWNMSTSELLHEEARSKRRTP